MRIHEYQAKQILEDFGVPVPPGKVATDPEEAAEIFHGLPGSAAVVKAQSYGYTPEGGRGVGLAHSAEQTAALARSMMGKRFGSAQLRSRPVSKVLVEEYVAVQRFLYLSVVMDPQLAKPVMLSAPLAPTHPPGVIPNDGVAREIIDPRFGTLSFQWRKVTATLGLDNALLPQVTAVASGLYRAFIECECIEAEIGKLGLTRRGELAVLEARMRFDSNALFRHEEIAGLRDPAEFTETENTLRAAWIRYALLGGRIGCLMFDTGSAVMLLDRLTETGARPGGVAYLNGDEPPEKIAFAITCLLREEAFRAAIIAVPRAAEPAGRLVAGLRLALQDEASEKTVVALAMSDDAARTAQTLQGLRGVVQVVRSHADAADAVGKD